MDYGTAARALVYHQPRTSAATGAARLAEHCQVCRAPWPCTPRQEAGQVIIAGARWAR